VIFSSLHVKKQGTLVSITVESIHLVVVV